MPLLLDACSCAGIGADGYANAGWDVVALDNDPRALKHNPYPTVKRDVLDALADRTFMAQFDAVHASFPCQGFSATRELARAQGRGTGRGIDLLTPGMPLLRALDIPWVVENVERSPVRHMPGAARTCGSAYGLHVQRHRWYAPSPGITLTSDVCDHSTFPRDPITNKPRPWGVYYAKGDNIPAGGRTATTLAHGMEVMGVTRPVPWKYLCEGLPPVFTENIGRQLLAQM